MNTPVDPSATLYVDTNLTRDDSHRIRNTPRCLVDIFDHPRARTYATELLELALEDSDICEDLLILNGKKKLKNQERFYRGEHSAAAGTAFFMSTSLPVAAPDRLQNPVFSLEPCLLPIEDGNVLDFPLSVDDIASMHRAIALNSRFTEPVNRSTSAIERAAEYRLPTLVHLTGLGPISDALVGRVSWDDPQVVRDVQTLLASPQGAIDYCSRWAQNATNQLDLAYRALMEADRICFPSHSYFKRDANEITVGDDEQDSDD